MTNKNMNAHGQDDARDLKAITLAAEPPLLRLARALVANPAGVTRNQADAIAERPNGPHYMMEFRRLMGFKKNTKRVPTHGPADRQSWYGVYFLLPEERAELLAVLDVVRRIERRAGE